MTTATTHPQLMPKSPWDHPVWLEYAPCRGMATAIFFPERGHPTELAKAVCNGCPFRQACLDYVLALPRATPGVWGGTSERQRRTMPRTRKRPPVAPHGTNARWHVERKRAEPHCAACSEAHNVYNRAWRESQRHWGGRGAQRHWAAG